MPGLISFVHVTRRRRNARHFAYPTHARATTLRRDNLRRSADELRVHLAKAEKALIVLGEANLDAWTPGRSPSGLLRGHCRKSKPQDRTPIRARAPCGCTRLAPAALKRVTSGGSRLTTGVHRGISAPSLRDVSRCGSPRGLGRSRRLKQRNRTRRRTNDHTYQGRLFWPSAFRDELLASLLAVNR